MLECRWSQKTRISPHSQFRKSNPCLPAQPGTWGGLNAAGFDINSLFYPILGISLDPVCSTGCTSATGLAKVFLHPGSCLWSWGKLLGHGRSHTEFAGNEGKVYNACWRTFHIQFHIPQGCFLSLFPVVTGMSTHLWRFSPWFLLPEHKAVPWECSHCVSTVGSFIYLLI